MAGDASLHKAAYDGNITEVNRLLQDNPNTDDRDSFGGTVLHAAMFQDNMQIIKLLIEHHYDVNAIGPQNGYTPMHDAVWANNIGAIKILLANGAQSNIKGKDGLTPYEKAKKEGKKSLVSFFEAEGIGK